MSILLKCTNIPNLVANASLWDANVLNSMNILDALTAAKNVASVNVRPSVEWNHKIGAI
mgnify:CR=1 FL=1